jgi:hypothetical protein
MSSNEPTFEPRPGSNTAKQFGGDVVVAALGKRRLLAPAAVAIVDLHPPHVQ